MVDLDLTFATNQRPTIGAFGTLFIPYMLPLGLAGNHWIDWKKVVDMGRGKPAYAHFRIATTFVGPAANTLRFFIAVGNQTNFGDAAVNPTQIITRGPDMLTANLIAFQSNGIGNAPTQYASDVDLVIPDLPMRAIPNPGDEGFQYLGLGFEALTPVSDWTQGGIDAWIDTFPGRVRPSAPAGT